MAGLPRPLSSTTVFTAVAGELLHRVLERRRAAGGGERPALGFRADTVRLRLTSRPIIGFCVFRAAKNNAKDQAVGASNLFHLAPLREFHAPNRSLLRTPCDTVPAPTPGTSRSIGIPELPIGQ